MIAWERAGKTDAQEIAWMIILILVIAAVVLRIVVKIVALRGMRQ
jgi:hypothetical protein